MFKDQRERMVHSTLNVSQRCVATVLWNSQQQRLRRLEHPGLTDDPSAPSQTGNPCCPFERLSPSLDRSKVKRPTCDDGGSVSDESAFGDQAPTEERAWNGLGTLHREWPLVCHTSSERSHMHAYG